MDKDTRTATARMSVPAEIRPEQVDAAVQVVLRIQAECYAARGNRTQ